MKQSQGNLTFKTPDPPTVHWQPYLLTCHPYCWRLFGEDGGPWRCYSDLVPLIPCGASCERTVTCIEIEIKTRETLKTLKMPPGDVTFERSHFGERAAQNQCRLWAAEHEERDNAK
jgi:hypothetical protein